MIKALGTINNRRTLILGLSRENTNRMHKDMPIVVDLQAFLQTADIAKDPIQDIVIFAGETEDAMKEQMIQTGLIPREE